MLLGNRNAAIYGGGGAIGGAFAREGARGFLAGLDEVVEEIRTPGGADEAAQLDALGGETAEEHAGEVAEGSIDVSFNAISIRDVQSISLVQTSREDFSSPTVTGTSTHFPTARAAERRKAERTRG